MSTKLWPYVGTLNYPPHAEAYLAARKILRAARRAKIVYLTADEMPEGITFPEKNGKRCPSDGLAIPVPGSDTGQVRFLGDGVKPKIKSVRGSRNCFYEAPFPPDSEHDWKDIREDASVALHIVEGPLKALACTRRDIPALGVNGVWGWKRKGQPIDAFKRFVWVGRLVILCFDSDVMQKLRVRQAMKSLGDHLIALGAKVKIKLLPSPDGKNVGADDYLAQSGAASFRKLQKLPLADPKFADWGAPIIVQELNQTLGFLMHDGRATILSVRDDPEYPGTRTVMLSRKSDVELEYVNECSEYIDQDGNLCRTQKFPVWLMHPARRKVRRITLLPGAIPGYDFRTGDYNLWQGWGVGRCKPDKTHSWAKLKRHIKKVIANGVKSHAKYILNYLAFCVQYPHRRPEVALALLGGEGTGKGITLNAMTTLFGRHGMHLASQRQLVGNFNAHLQDKLFVFADEAFFAGSKEAVGTLKSMITEPTRVIEPKFVNAYELPNYTKLVIASNENWVVPADLDARRFAVFRVSDERRGDFDYFKAIGDELCNGGYEAMLFELQHRNLSGFDPRQIPPTQALFEQKKLSFSVIENWWFESLCEGHISPNVTWPRTVERDQLLGEIMVRVKNEWDKHALATKMGIELKKLCPALVDMRASKDHRRKYCYALPPLDNCRAAFEKAVQTTVDWKTGKALEAGCDE